MEFIATGARSHPLAGTLFEVIIRARGSPSAPEPPWCVAFMIQSSMIKTEAFQSSLSDFGLSEGEIEVVAQRVETVQGFTGTFLAKGQELTIDHLDGINQVLVQKFAGGYTPTTVGAYTVVQ